MYLTTTIKVLFLCNLQGDGGVSTKVRRDTITLNRDEIKDTPGYSEVPVQNSVSIQYAGMSLCSSERM